MCIIRKFRRTKRKKNKDGLNFLGSIPGDEQPLDSVDHLVCTLEKQNAYLIGKQKYFF